MDLNNDVVTEILLRLPVHSVLRFKSVCKSWCNIIDSSTFRESHRQNQSKNNEDETLLLQFTNTCNTDCTWDVSTYNTGNGKYRKSFPAITEFLNDKGWANFLVAGPVNGLICMYNETPYSEGDAWDPSIAIYNPCLDKIKILPVSPICSSLSYESWRMSEFKWVLGFGFDSVTKDYKVVQLTSFWDGRRTRVEVCSGTTNAWRELVIDDDELFDDEIEGIKSCAHMNSGSWAHFKTENVILSFDMQNEVFETIPYLVLEDRPYLYLGLYEVFAKDDDSFALFLPSSDYERIEVWEVERSGDKERGWNHVVEERWDSFDGIHSCVVEERLDNLEEIHSCET